jgi:2-polyprenyl-3-methyl-5-hydroxy-6-metoxy-1,4-benzoquinol methylase
MESKNKDWSGNQTSIFSTLGSSSHSKDDRHVHDYYATHPKATEWLVKLEKFNKQILEPACGEGHISNILSKNGYNVISTDLIERGFGGGGYRLPYN